MEDMSCLCHRRGDGVATASIQGEAAMQGGADEQGGAPGQGWTLRRREKKLKQGSRSAEHRFWPVHPVVTA